MKKLLTAGGVFAGLFFCFYCFLTFFSFFSFGQASRLTFETVSVKPMQTDGPRGGIRVMPGGREFRAEGATLRLMLAFMYWVPERQITGGPSWLDSELWSIDAKADHPRDLEELREMFRNMLTDEFRLKLRPSTKEGPIYALTVDKGGLKMTRDEEPWDFEVSIKTGPGGASVGKRVSIQRLCFQLQQILQADARPVVDQTGLPGYYDFTLLYRPELPPGFDTSSLKPQVLDRPSIFDAVRQQLGLRLEARKGPVQYYAVEQALKPDSN